MKSKKFVFFISIGIIIVLAFLYFIFLRNPASSKKIFQAEVMDDEYNKKYVNIYSNGDTKKIQKVSFKKQDETVIVDADVYRDPRSLESRFKKNYTLENQNHKKVTDKNFYKIVNKIVPESQYDIANLNIFKLDNREYYVYLSYNVGLSDDGTIYKYNPSNGKLNEICTVESIEIIKLKK